MRLPVLCALACAAACAQVRVLDDFESSASRTRWEGPLSISPARAAHGAASARIALTREHPRISSRQLGADWSGFDRLALDLFSESAVPKPISLAIYDVESPARYDYFDANSKVLLLAGWNHVEVDLRALRAASGARAIDLHHILRFVLYAERGELPLTLHIDNLRLVNGKEPAATASRTAPADARITIDNRWFSVRQVAEPDEVPESQAVRALRTTASREAESLRAAIRVAQLQGIDTIYSERRLVIADLGLHLRPLLAWFNNDAEKSRMFRYVADACRDERRLLEHQLNGVARMEEADDTQARVPAVPPLPQLRDSPHGGWFFRDDAGAPLMVLSLHSQSDALQRFFATPLQHIESYSVGGGSRWTIEQSPVYAAFQKYSDTHRAGWDGWCGHLVKDLDSMGGTRRENVVICLESRHTRDAIEEYIRTNTPKLRENPNLLYNILAYEMMYICYCDESRRMFAHWLREKHGSIARANECWGTHYASFEEVVPPPVRNARPLPDTNRALWFDWAVFNQDRFTAHLAWVRDTVRKYDARTPLAAGGSSSMLSGRAGTAGIDEERIVNEIDDVIIHEGGGSTLGLDLQVALSTHPKPIADPEMNLESVANLLPHLLHGKSVVQLFHWSTQPPAEFVSTIESSLPHSWRVSLDQVDGLLKAVLDARRLRSEIAAFVEQPAHVAILYSRTSTLQVPPEMLGWERTPYLHELERTYEASRFLDAKTTFITERQIARGELSRYALLLIPGAPAIPADIAGKIRDYVAAGGRVLASPESLSVDEYNRPRDYLTGYGLRVARGESARPGATEAVRRYDQTFTADVDFRQAAAVSVTPADPDWKALGTLHAHPTAERLQLTNATPALRYADGTPALSMMKLGKGVFYYAAANWPERDYTRLLDQLFTLSGIPRARRAVPTSPALWKLESRAAVLNGRKLQYITNNNAEPATVTLQDATGRILPLRELRNNIEARDGRLTIAPGDSAICEILSASSASLR